MPCGILRVNVCQRHVNNVLHEVQDTLSFLKEVATHTALKPERLGAALPKSMQTGRNKWHLQLNAAGSQNVKKHCIWLQLALQHQLKVCQGLFHLRTPSQLRKRARVVARYA